MTGEQKLGTFIDRYTFRYEREYPHPPERVWEAITMPEHLNAWFLPYNRIERELGGRFHFTFGRDDEDPTMWSGTIAQFAPPEVVEYVFDHGGRIRFDLRRTGSGTLLYFTQHFPPGFRHDDGMPETEALGSDLPGGPDTPWRPGLLAGYHGSLTSLGTYLDGKGPTLEQMLATLETIRDGTYDDPVNASLTVAYRALIKETITGGVKEEER